MSARDERTRSPGVTAPIRSCGVNELDWGAYATRHSARRCGGARRKSVTPITRTHWAVVTERQSTAQLLPQPFAPTPLLRPLEDPPMSAPHVLYKASEPENRVTTAVHKSAPPSTPLLAWEIIAWVGLAFLVIGGVDLLMG